ncbi:MAG: hypothetical protein K2X72_12020 [Reyranella sp.]|nr:hypothetical protein [Reyranella sp.]
MVDTVIVEQEAQPSSAVCWPAVIAGGFVAAAFTLLFLALGAGLGFSVVSPWRGAPDITTTKAATVGGIFMAVTAVMASALGGYIAGRLRTRWQAIPDEVYFRDTAHGLLAWAFATVMGALILGSAATVLSGGVAAGAGEAVQRADYVDPFLDRLFRPDYAALTGGTGQRAAGVFAAGRDLAADREAARRVLVSMVRGDSAAADRQYLAQMVAARTGVDAAEADRRIAATETEIRAAADNARRIGMHVAFWLVASMLLGALAASLAALEGGALRDGRRWSL